ncbi:hypothetical protein Scep_006268 [Stephania cephalantha]|uniref:F-box domain-containing protein n=1 Tax=Stephania cephalantha TaxID=152367 RepID=A0AAP0K7S7_9MAGN
MASLIPGLPDDVALFCLARVPRRLHPLLRCVSRSWRDVVGSSDALYTYRKKHSLDETWVYALCGGDKSDEHSCYVLDPNSKTRCWRLVRGLPQQCMRRKGMGFEALGRRCYLMGGCGWFQDATDEVYCYDAAVDAWDAVAAPMATPRYTAIYRIAIRPAMLYGSEY